ncbi:MAG: uridylate kinase [Clostridia bacterium]|nr:uridylate kinase [Clostridia bacterium]
MALINQYRDDMDYNIISMLGKELKPGYVWITSGAAEIGRLDYIKRTGKELNSGNLEMDKIDYAAQGQSIIMTEYRRFISPKYGIRQILVEHQHFNDEAKRDHLKNVLIRCAQQGTIPIINYNDPVSDEEVRKLEIRNLKKDHRTVVECVDNDETASQIACILKPKILLILTSVDGIYTKLNDESSLVKEIAGKDVYETINSVEYYQNFANGASRKGAHGARAKLEYIKKPVMNGTTVYIANSKYKISDIITGKAPSTKICTR